MEHTRCKLQRPLTKLVNISNKGFNMRNLPTLQLNIREDYRVVKEGIETFLQQWNAYTGPIAPGTILRLIKAHIEDTLMPTKYYRTTQVLQSTFPNWYLPLAQADLNNPDDLLKQQAVRSLHQSYLEDAFFALEQKILVEKPVEDYIWETIFGPYGIALLIPVVPYEEPKVEVQPQAKLICSHVTRDRRTNEKKLKVRRIPATLDDEDVDPNQFILMEAGQRPTNTNNYGRTRNGLMEVKSENPVPDAILRTIEAAIRERIEHTESKYQSSRVIRLPHGYRRV